MGGLAGWVIQRLRKGQPAAPRLALIDRITLAPRQMVALVEAEGQRILVATSAEGAAVFYRLDGENRACECSRPQPQGRVS